MIKRFLLFVVFNSAAIALLAQGTLGHQGFDVAWAG